MIGSRFNRLEAWEVVEVASDSISRYWDAAKRGLVDLDANPAAYLSTIARNAALDLLAGSPRADDEPLDDEGAEDIDLERILNREQALSRLDGIRRVAIANRDHVAVQVITTWLDLAEETQRSPTSRAVAARAGMSHTSVNRALDRLRNATGGGAFENAG